jgi:hypothetical protein
MRVSDPRLWVPLLAALTSAAAVVAALLTRGSDSHGSPSAQTSARPAAALPVAERTVRLRRRGCSRPYNRASPWNVPVGSRPRYHPQTHRIVANLGAKLTSDPTQYTYPVYEVGRGTPRRRVHVSGTWSNVVDGGSRLRLGSSTVVDIPLPDGARAAAGSDAQIVIVDRATGDEWGAWQLEHAGGTWRAENAYHYNVRWSGVPPRSPTGRAFGSRGAGVPYLAGLVRPCEIARGRIEHALAFAYDAPSPSYVYPATKSDGRRRGPGAVPEGTRLQLDPGLSAHRIRRFGCNGPCLTLARALQRYGMYVIDNSGRAKVMLEYEGTARWGGVVNEHTVSPIPLSAFRVVAP